MDELHENAQAAARALAAQAGQVAYAQRFTHRKRQVLRRISRDRLGRGPIPVVHLASPWQDTLSFERGSEGWRARIANLGAEEAFGVDYRVCRRCKTVWVEQPFTYPSYQRCGLASAALAQLRAEHPGYSWHTRRTRAPRPPFLEQGWQHCARRLPSATALRAPRSMTRLAWTTRPVFDLQETKVS